MHGFLLLLGKTSRKKAKTISQCKISLAPGFDFCEGGVVQVLPIAFLF
jgi:hypothetical protein